MQPLVLKMTAFGPYKQTETIDFRKLRDHKLFVISGSTGAGKTTIFDGICFALFGSASGSDRDNQTMLRSDFADDDTHTSVELTFALNQRTYRILRQLGHVKQGNKSKTGERYEFYEQQEEKEVPCVDRQIVSEIDEKVEALLGLTEDQFKQIVMLPQGEFRKLLTSKTENKEAILRRLFKTESYQQINERLKVKKDNAEENYRRMEQTRDMYIQQIAVKLPERENALLFDVLREEHYNSHQIIAGLEEETAYYHERIKADDARYNHAYEAHEKKQVQYHQTQMINEKFRALEDKRKRLEALNEQIPTFRKKEEQLKRAEQASKIIPYEKQRDEWRATEKRNNQAAQESEKAKQVADERHHKVQGTYEQEKNKQDKREEASRNLDRLKQFLPTVQAIDTKQKEIENLQKEVNKAEETYKQAVSDLEKIENRIKNDEADIHKMETTLDELPQEEDHLKDMRETHRILKRYIDLQDKHKILHKKLVKQKELYELAKAKYDASEEKWLDSQASILAGHLQNGDPCPVCGSTAHPNKASSDHAIATKEELDGLKSDLEQQNNAYRTVQAEVKSCLDQMDEAAEALREKEIAPADAKVVSHQLIEDGKQLNEKVEHLKGLRKKLNALKKTSETSKTDKRKLEAAKEKRNETLQASKIELAKQQSAFEVGLRGVPEEVRVLNELKKQISVAAKYKEKLEQDWEQAQNDLQSAEKERTKATSDMTHAKEQLTETIAKHRDAAREFQEALKEASLPSEEVYQEAKMNPEHQQELKAEITTFNQNIESFKQQVTELQTELKEKKPVDLHALEQECEQLKAKVEETRKKMDRSRTYHRDAMDLLQDIQKTSADVDSRARELAVVADLFNMMRGQNSQKISFERYLQIEYLEQIIHTANLRLKNLSNGQFLLMRSDRQESHGRQSGLAFDVYDAYTGQTRDVKTLSGGEKFNTSLCLALGMSDVIQSFQGNVSMKTMFIDEGFGSLDEESLHKAIDALIELQKSGRTIGVISHVQELKAILPAALEVMKTKEGSSHTEFVLK